MELTCDRKVPTTVGVTASPTVAVFIVVVSQVHWVVFIPHTSCCKMSRVVLLGTWVYISSEDDVIRHMQPNNGVAGSCPASTQHCRANNSFSASRGPMAAIGRAALILPETACLCWLLISEKEIMLTYSTKLELHKAETRRLCLLKDSDRVVVK
jgi:hypothetical protein